MSKPMPTWMQEFIDPEDTLRALGALHVMQPVEDIIPGSSMSTYNPTQADPHTRTIHWGPYDDASSTGSVGTKVLNPAHFGPGGIVKAPGGLATVLAPTVAPELASSTGSTVLEPASRGGTSSATGSAISRTIDSSTGSTVLDAAPYGSEISHTASSSRATDIFAAIDAQSGVSSGSTSVPTAGSSTTATSTTATSVPATSSSGTTTSAKSFLGSVGTGEAPSTGVNTGGWGTRSPMPTVSSAGPPDETP